MNSGPHPDCPEEKVLQEIAAEARPADAYAETILHHAAQCSHCGPILSRYLNEFSDEPVAELQAPNKGEEPAWQNALARELAQKSRPKAAPPLPDRDNTNVLRFPVWARITAWAAPIAAAVVLAVLAGPGMYAKYELKKANDLVAADYAQHRNTEMRPAGVPYGEYKPAIHELGPDANSLGLNRPDLAKANGILADHQNTNDPKWTRQEGRIALLKGADGLKQAEDAFERAKAEGMNDPGLEIDLAVTYFERDSRSDNPNLAPTIDLLNHVLKNPKLTTEQRNTALFDLAIAYEKSNMLDMAADTWTEYLKADTNTSGGWYKEAQQRLNDLKKKLPPPRAADFRQPSYLLRHLDDPEVQNDIEQFQDFALAHWLPDAFKNPGSDSARAIHAIADLMQNQHGDTWWRDFLRSTTAQDLPAIEAASAAFLSSENDLHYQALQHAKKAAEVFHARRDFPGEVMAQFAAVYALQRSIAGKKCFDRGAELAARLEKATYRWFDGQIAIEKSICANLIFDFRSSDAELRRSKDIAQRGAFPELALRALGIEASMQRLRGDPGTGWIDSVAALPVFWHSPLSWERLYQFYEVMHLSADNLDLPNTSESMLRRAIAILQEDAPDDSILRAHLYLYLANLLYLQGQDVLADKELDTAAAVLKSVAATEPAAATYYAASIIEMAGLHISRGRADLAVRDLEPLAHVLHTQDDFIKMDYYRTIGSARLEVGDVTSAEGAFRDGIRVADAGLSHLKDDEGRVLWVKATDNLYRGIAELLVKEKRERDALQVWEWAKSRSFGGLNSRPSIEQVFPVGWRAGGAGTLNRAGVQRLVYASFPSHLQIWFDNGDTIETQTVDVRAADLARLAQQFAKQCSVPEQTTPSKADLYGAQLYSILIKPIQQKLLQDSELVIEPDDSISGIPFEALRSPEGWYIDDRFVVSYSPGINAERSLRSPVSFSSADLFVLADASGAAGSTYLPGHETVVNAVEKLPFKHRIISTHGISPDGFASRIAFVNGLLFFGHARQNGSGMALELQPGVLATTRDLALAVNPKLKLVVLAACSSGVAENGILNSRSLVRTFLGGGVPFVIASHWNVDARTTAYLMHDFLEGLGENRPAAALRAARRHIRTGHSHPYFWAPFTLTGVDAPYPR